MVEKIAGKTIMVVLLNAIYSKQVQPLTWKPDKVEKQWVDLVPFHIWNTKSYDDTICTT